MVQVAVRLDAETIAELDDLAAIDGMTRSEIMREAVKWWIMEHTP